jgi:hypothetical protein
MKLGTKSITTTGIFLASLFLGLKIYEGIDVLLDLPFSVWFTSGLFASVMTYMFMRFWHLDRPSRYRLFFGQADRGDSSDFRLFKIGRRSMGIGLNTDNSRDFVPAVQKSVYLAFFFACGLVIISPRAIDLILDFPLADDKFSGYCPETSEDPFSAPELQGCKLVLKAYNLGYTKDLKNCEKEFEEKVETEICTLRQLDEPYLHYAYRLLRREFATLYQILQDNSYNVIKANIEKQLKDLMILVNGLSHAMQADPRSSHHLFVNLPHPEGWFMGTLRDTFDPGLCLRKFLNMANAPRLNEEESETSASQWVEHILGQVLFDPQYTKAVGNCREYIIHWDSDQEECQKLSDDSEGFLKESGALDQVKIVLDRVQKIQEKVAIKKTLVTKQAQNEDEAQEEELPSIQKIVSFQCLNFSQEKTEDSPRGIETLDVSLLGHRFEIRSTTFAPKVLDSGDRETSPLPAALYGIISELFAPGFTYSALKSQQLLEQKDIGKLAEDWLNSPDFLLSNLEVLKAVDVMLGTSISFSPVNRDFYPWHIHLSRYVARFREDYRAQRGRL